MTALHIRPNVPRKRSHIENRQRPCIADSRTFFSNNHVQPYLYHQRDAAFDLPSSNNIVECTFFPKFSSFGSLVNAVLVRSPTLTQFWFAVLVRILAIRLPLVKAKLFYFFDKFRLDCNKLAIQRNGGMVQNNTHRRAAVLSWINMLTINLDDNN
jgi:hypothetical protein